MYSLYTPPTYFSTCCWFNNDSQLFLISLHSGFAQDAHPVMMMLTVFVACSLSRAASAAVVRSGIGLEVKDQRSGITRRNFDC